MNVEKMHEDEHEVDVAVPEKKAYSVYAFSTSVMVGEDSDP